MISILSAVTNRLGVKSPMWPVLLLLGCSIQQKLPQGEACVQGKACTDSGSSAAPPVVLVPPAMLDEGPDSGRGILPECAGMCDPDDRESLVCLVPKQRDVDASAAVSSELKHLFLIGADAAAASSAGAEPPVSDAASVDADVALDAAAWDAQSVDATLGDARTPTDAAGSPSVDAPSSYMDADVDASDAQSLDASQVTDSSGSGLEPVNNEAGVGGQTMSRLACQVLPDELTGKLHSACAPSGEGVERGPCSSSRDCGPGLGCVETAAGGQCLPFCCGGQSSCAAGSYCARQKLRGASSPAAETPTIPVCAPGEKCMLGGSCANMNACTVVDAAGTLACVAPGTGRQGQACPCEAGYVCSQGTQICLKLCQTQQAGSCGSGASCQPGPKGYPAGWGSCVAVL